MSVEQYANDAASTLASTLNSGATSISLTNGSTFPTGPHRVRIENEIILIASRSSNTLTVATNGRGSEGTSDVQHASSTTVEHVLTRRGLFNSPGVFDVRAYGAVGNGSTDDSAAIQAALDAAAANGGGVVHLPAATYSIGTTSLTIGGDGVVLQGDGKRTTFIEYTGSGAALKNSNTANIRRGCKVSGLQIDITGASGSAVGIEIANFLRCRWEDLRINAITTSFTGIKMYGEGSMATYYNQLTDIEITTDGICLYLTGPGSVNGNIFTFINCDGNNGQALKSDPSTLNNGENVFINFIAEEMDGNPVIHLTGSGGAATTNSTFIGWRLEGCTYGPTCDTGSSQAIYNLAIGGDISSGGAPSGWTDTNTWIRSDRSTTFCLTLDGKLDPQYLNLPIKAGVPSDSDVWAPASGDVFLDTTNSRIYFRVGSTWKYATLT